MIQVSIQTLLLSLHALAKERQAVGARLDAGDYSEDELDELNDQTDRLTSALGELADLYEPLREGQEQVYPAVESILALYD
jgi:hypothetical protein